MKSGKQPTVEELQKVADQVHREMVHGKPLTRDEIVALVDESARKALRGGFDPFGGKVGLCLPMPPNLNLPVRNHNGQAMGFLRGARVEKLEGFTRLTVTIDLAITGAGKGIYDPQLLDQLKEREPDPEEWGVDLEGEFE